MKTILVICALIITCVYNAAVASASGLLVKKLQKSVENDLICGLSGISEKEYRQLLAKTGMKIVIFRSVKDEHLAGYEGLFIHKKGKENIKIFGFDLMAIYFEPENFHFQALLNTDKEQVFNIVKSRRPDAYENQIIVKYNPDYSPGGHHGKHMDDGGDNSNRVLFAIPKFKAPSGGDFSIEVESCEETKSKWFAKICSQFDRKPLTWMGCAMTSPERAPKILPLPPRQETPLEQEND
jgi:hypothetical protein